MGREPHIQWLLYATVAKLLHPPHPSFKSIPPFTASPIIPLVLTPLFRPRPGRGSPALHGRCANLTRLLRPLHWLATAIPDAVLAVVQLCLLSFAGYVR